MKKLIAALTLLLVFFLGGCAQKQTYWNHQTKNETQFYAESGNCELKAFQAYPQRYNKNHCLDNSAYFSEEWESLEDAFCWETDKNERVRQGYFNRCMVGLGYQSYTN